jgi:hypothetical protein
LERSRQLVDLYGQQISNNEMMISDLNAVYAQGLHEADYVGNDCFKKITVNDKDEQTGSPSICISGYDTLVKKHDLLETQVSLLEGKTSNNGHPQNPSMKCETGTHPEILHISLDGLPDNGYYPNTCIPNTTNAKFWHDWFNGGCYWTSDLQFADHITKINSNVKPTLYCNGFDGFMSTDNKYGNNQVGNGQQYTVSPCVDETVEVDGVCYSISDDGKNSQSLKPILDALKNPNTKFTMNETTIKGNWT